MYNRLPDEFKEWLVLHYKTFSEVGMWSSTPTGTKNALADIFRQAVARDYTREYLAEMVKIIKQTA